MHYIDNIKVISFFLFSSEKVELIAIVFFKKLMILVFFPLQSEHKKIKTLCHILLFVPLLICYAKRLTWVIYLFILFILIFLQIIAFLIPLLDDKFPLIRSISCWTISRFSKFIVQVLLPVISIFLFMHFFLI